ncbi:MAG TPA: hypothetical protein VIM53_02255 [Candidatus Saccharimonadales bacterium]
MSESFDVRQVPARIGADDPTVDGLYTPQEWASYCADREGSHVTQVIPEAVTPEVAQLRQAAALRRGDVELPSHAQSGHRAERRGWRAHKFGLAAGAVALAGLAGAGAVVNSWVHGIESADTSGQKYTAAPQTPYSPSPEASSASPSASASATSPSALPSILKSSAAPTHEATIAAAPATSAAPSPKPTTPSPSPVRTTQKPAAECTTEPSSPDPIIECSPEVIPTDLAGSAGTPEKNLAIEAASTNVHVRTYDSITVDGIKYVEVYDPAQANGNNGTGWIPQSYLTN